MTLGDLKEPHRTLHEQIPATPCMLSGSAVRPFDAVGDLVCMKTSKLTSASSVAPIVSFP